jgi:hypothetical protein
MLPSSWKEGVVLPILKPGKDPSHPSSYWLNSTLMCRKAATTTCCCSSWVHSGSQETPVINGDFVDRRVLWMFSLD